MIAGPFLVDCAGVITRELEAGLHQRDIATSYALAIISENAGVERPDWGAINGAIKKRWPKGLDRVKKMAWNIVENGP